MSSVIISTSPWTFTLRNSSLKIYIYFTIFYVRILSKELLLSESSVYSDKPYQNPVGDLSTPGTILTGA